MQRSEGFRMLVQDLRAAAHDGRPTAVTLGNFDGVHSGHRLVVDRLRCLANENRFAAAVVTFYPDPVRVLRQDCSMPYLLTLEERIERLREAGADLVAPLNFTKLLAKVSAEEFVEAL